MKEQEKIFFVLCYQLRHTHSPREVIRILNETIPHKQCWYYLEKWLFKGFYDFGTNLELGWFEKTIPEPYRSLIEVKD